VPLPTCSRGPPSGAISAQREEAKAAALRALPGVASVRSSSSSMRRQRRKKEGVIFLDRRVIIEAELPA
jgi:hypothetical protein